LFGQVGAGRTEILRSIFGLENIETGEIHIDNQIYNAKSPVNAISHEIGFLTEDRKNQGLVLNLSIADNFLMGVWNMVKKWFVIDEKKKAAISQEKMESLHIKAQNAFQEVGSLSGGNQQKVVLGKWLIRNSKILLLDEPTKGIDVGAKLELYSIIKDLAGKGISVLMVSSELPEIMILCDRVLVLKDGAITGEFNISVSNEKEILEKAL
jgi:ribose transport system ATP-binding protein